MKLMKTQPLHRPHKVLFITISYMIWASVTLRWIMVSRNPAIGNEWVYIPLGVFGVLIGLEPWIVRTKTWRAHLYFAIQSGMIFISSLFFYEIDFFALLYMPLAGQVIYLLPRRSAYTWIVTLLILNFIGQSIQFGLPNGLSFIFLYTAGLIFTAGFAIFALQAEESQVKTESLLAELQVGHQKLQEYAVQIEQLAIVQERNRLARDLHDSVTQALYGLTLQSEAAARQLHAGQTILAAAQIREVRDIAHQALREMRLMIFELRPPILDEEGLIPALQARLDAVENRSGLQATLKAENIGRLPLEIENGLYGIAREALNNILKHANAQRVELALSQVEGKIDLNICDDGVGFDSEKAGSQSGLGLSGMHERAAQMGGTLTIESQPKNGAHLHIQVPL